MRDQRWGRDRRSRVLALIAAVIIAAVVIAAVTGTPVIAQQAAPPPAVLVQAAENVPIARQSECIGRATASPGNIVGPDSGVLATVVSETPIRVLFPVTQRELLEARKDKAAGDPVIVRLRLADGNFYNEKGQLDFIDVTVDPKTDG